MNTLARLLVFLWLSVVPLFAADHWPAMPSNPPELQPLLRHDTPAWRAVRHFQRGVNLGYYLEVPPGQDWGVRISDQEFLVMRRQGFDHVRIPMGWHHYTGPGPDFTISPEFFTRADLCVTNALAAGLAVMLNIHHFKELDADPEANADKFVALWRQIASHYVGITQPIAFELDNEPHDQATTAKMNPIYARAIAAIRAIDPRHSIVVEPGHWGSIDELKNLTLPPDDNLFVSVHCYEPFYFTHQGASWAGPDVHQTGVVFPGPPVTPLIPDPSLQLKPWVVDWFKKYNTLPSGANPSGPSAFRDKLQFAADWAQYYGRPVHLGEFGAIEKADARSRANFCSALRRECQKHGIGWCLWDWNAGFHYWDVHSHAPAPGMHEALFGGNP